MWLNNNRKLIAGLFAVMIPVFAWFITRIGVVYDFEQFFPKGDPNLEFYFQFREQFEPDDNYLLLAIPAKDRLFSIPTLQEIDSLTQACRSLPYVNKVYSITRQRRLLITPLGPVTLPLINMEEPEKLEKDSIRIMQDERLAGKLISQNGKTAFIIMVTEPLLKQKESEILNDALFDLMKSRGYGENEFHVAGRANIQSVFVRNQIQEMTFYTLLSGIIVFVSLWFIFRKWGIVLIAMTSIGTGLIIFLGLLGLLGIRLDFMSALFPILMLIVGMSDVIHLLSKFMDERMAGKSEQEAMRITVREIGLAILLTSLTTAIGFLGLSTSRIFPVQKFGYTAAMGVFVAYFTVMLLTPALILIFSPQVSGKTKQGWLFWQNWLNRIDEITSQRKGLVARIALLLLIPVAFGISRISLNADLRTDLPKGLKISSDFLFIETEMGGFRPLEIALFAGKDKTIHDPEVIREIDRLETFLRGTGKFSGLQSPASIYKNLHRAHNGDMAAYERLPEEDALLNKYRKMMDRAAPQMFNLLISEDEKSGRLTGKTSDIGSEAGIASKKKITDWAELNLNPELLTIRQTGTGVLFDQNNRYMLQSLFSGLGLAFAVVSLLMAFLFRDLKMAILSLIPNIFPLLATAALMGISGVALDAPTSIIFTISFGIAVDDSIHFLSRYRLERAKGKGRDEAISVMLRMTGKAVILTTIVLFFGFILLVTSNNNGTFRVGFLVSITLLFALLADLFLLPVLLRRFEKE